MYQIQDIVEECEESYRYMHGLRKNYNLFVYEYVGYNHGSHIRSIDRRPANEFKRYVDTVASELVGQTPQCLVTTTQQDLKPTAYELQYTVNKQFKKQKIENVVRRMVKQMCFSPVSMYKIMVGADYTVSKEKEELEHESLYGTTYTESIPFSRVVIDMDSETPEGVRFLGCVYPLPYDFVKKSPLFKNTGKLVPADRTNVFLANDYNSINRRIEFSRKSIDRKVYVWDLYIPSENRHVIIPVQQYYYKAIYDERWTGPEGGPYRMWVQSEIPEMPVGIQPLAALYDFQYANNDVLNKLMRQGLNQKYITAVQRGGGKDIEKMRLAADGTAIGVDSPDKIKEVSMGGYYPNNMPLYLRLADLASKYSGNIDIRAGASPQTETLGQYEGDRASANAGVRSIQISLQSELREMVYHYGFHEFENIFTDEKVPKKVGRAGNIEIEKHFTDEKKRGDFTRYNFDINMYSLIYRTPQERDMELAMQMREYAELMPAFQQQGLAPDMKKYLEMKARYKNMPELADMWTTVPPIVDDKQVGSPPRKVTENIRRNVSQRTERGTTEGMISDMYEGAEGVEGLR